MNITPPTLRGYPATQGLDLPPVIGIDPGARWTSIAVRIGRECHRAATIRNVASRRSGAHPDLVPVHRHRVVRNEHLVDEDAVQRVIAEVGRILADPVLDALARAWWATQDLPIADGDSPWLIAVELTVEPRFTPAGQREKDGRVYEVSVREAGDYGAANTIGSAIGTALDPVLWIAPRSADVRDQWGTGNPYDYWPSNLLTVQDARIGGIPGRRTCSAKDLANPKRRDQQDGLGHVRAAYSVATDAGIIALDSFPRHRPSEICPPPKWTLRLAQLRGWAVQAETPAQRAALSSLPGIEPTTTVPADTKREAA